jgi:hypothetical protein
LKIIFEPPGGELHLLEVDDSKRQRKSSLPLIAFLGNDVLEL